TAGGAREAGVDRPKSRPRGRRNCGGGAADRQPAAAGIEGVALQTAHVSVASPEPRAQFAAARQTRRRDWRVGGEGEDAARRSRHAPEQTGGGAGRVGGATGAAFAVESTRAGCAAGRLRSAFGEGAGGERRQSRAHQTQWFAGPVAFVARQPRRTG